MLDQLSPKNDYFTLNYMEAFGHPAHRLTSKLQIPKVMPDEPLPLPKSLKCSFLRLHPLASHMGMKILTTVSLWAKGEYKPIPKIHWVVS